jgi:hypothetical protein
MAAERADDLPALVRILGPGGSDLVRSGDATADRMARERIVGAYDAAHRVEIDRPGTAALLLGPDDWSLPIPIVRTGDRWRFDTAASLQKILDRRVGRNELSVIEVCREYVAAQREYRSTEHPHDGVREYATKFSSTAGRHDGLYWATGAGEAPSPLGPLVASARAEGYGSREGDAPAMPFHGYFFRILTRQGSHAPGGAKDYMAHGHLTRGFALLAFPAKWGDSGIMTFVVDQNGIVFEKNLGPDTGHLARAMQEYDPDASWTPR